MNAITKTAIITGGGSGIGRAAAIALSDAYNLVLVGRRIETLQATVEDMSSSVSSTLLVPADLSNPDAIGEIFRQTQDQFGRLDVLFNNAGTGAPPGVLLEDLTLDQWQTVVNVNLTAAFLCTQAAFRLMKNQNPRGGRIINNGSISAHTPRPDSAPYTTTKSTALDGRKYDIACGQIDIGNAETPMTARMKAGVAQPNGTTEIEPTMDASNVGGAVRYMADLPLDANALFMTVMATKMPYVGRG